MAPVPTVNPAEKRERSSTGSTEKRSDFLMRPKYQNTLPDLPFDPKFISYPFGNERFVKYSTTSLEKNFVYEVLTEPDLGVEVELVIPDAYSVPPEGPAPLDPIDEKLLEDEILPQKNQKRSRHHAKSVSWLRRTEYISTEQTRFQPQTIDKVEAKVGYSVKKLLKDEVHYMDHEAQIKAIEKTFDDALLPIGEHFSKPGVTPEYILPIFPDFKLWKYPSAQVIFDSDPAPVGLSVSSQLEEMSQAMIRGVMDESGEQFVAYFLPTEETLEKRKKDQEAGREYDDDEVYEYRMTREYNWNVKTKATKGFEESYFFIIRDEGVFYNELETKVRLSKRRTRGPNQQLNTRLCVKHIPLSSADYKFQKKRERDLEPLMEEDEDEEEETEKVLEGNRDDDSDKSDNENEEKKSEKSDKSDKEEEGEGAKKSSKSPKSDKSSSSSSSDSDSDKSKKSSDSDDSDSEKENTEKKTIVKKEASSSSSSSSLESD